MPKSRAQTEAQSVVYFFQRGDGLIKIGTTRNLKNRWGAIENGAGPIKLLALISGSYLTESKLHSRFAHARQFGEWFSPTDEMLDLIEKARSRD